MTKHRNKSALGRGLDSLLSGGDISGSSSISELLLSDIAPNPDQPRKEFDTKGLEELATSIKAIGLVQPITVQDLGSSSYMIISGERRWRACQMAGLDTIPAYIRKVEDGQVMEMALVENIQREDLNAIEIALAYKKLLEVFGLTQDELGKRVGKGRATVSNYLRLLKLPAEVQLGLCEHKVDMGHARALLQLDEAEKQILLYSKIIDEGLSVRKVEELARDWQQGKTEIPLKLGSKKKEKEIYKALAAHLEQFFCTKVSVNCNDKGSGKLTIAFTSEDELERIMLLFEKIRNT
ncbi:chromosome partitioning protein ParB [Porphyromonas macacae]|uniref:Chromosome partitioning protein ParB n=1 Tax=Porphyromonas macacae TaxID=28115 RepID=A0A0A2G8S3_9PORP|nr:ParB/RepB/Spo0J family partition protein [Porphyromonas macacae]KGN75180.1 chromosome partitioning protein ParB [Porphyromonas macacae]KGN99683.1 chromosome partitioning protein ParB [Porphyromonas macacae]